MAYAGGLTVVLLTAALAGPALAEVLEGRIVEDHSGRPLASVEVRLSKVGEAMRVADLETDADGRFQVSGLAAGEYRVEVSKPSYIGMTLSLRLPKTALQLRLVRLGAIAGRITDGEGRPARGARVFAMVQPGPGLPLQAAGVGINAVAVNETGEYRLYNLPPGRYAVAASFTSFDFDGRSGLLLYPDTTRPEFFAVTGGEEYSGIDFTRLPAPEFRVSGSVVSASARGPWTILLLSTEQPAFPIATARTDAGNNFRLEGVPLGSYDLVASGPTSATGTQGVLLGRDPTYGRIHVEVSGGDIDGLVIPAAKGRSVSFLLRAQGAQGAKACSQSVTLTLSPIEAMGSSRQGSIELSLGKEGTLDDLAPGRYRVGVWKIDEGCYLASRPLVDLSEGDPSSPVEIVLAPAGSIFGRLSAGSERAEEFAVVLVSAGERDSAAAVQVAYPDAEARFSFSGLRPGRYWIAAHRNEDSIKARWIPDLSRMFEIEVPGGEPTDVDLVAQPMEDEAEAR